MGEESGLKGRMRRGYSSLVNISNNALQQMYTREVHAMQYKYSEWQSNNSAQVGVGNEEKLEKVTQRG